MLGREWKGRGNACAVLHRKVELFYRGASQAKALHCEQWVFFFLFLIALFASPALRAHHFKGLPHYNYFENYPQIPEEEFLGQSGKYEFSLVVYDFQGIDRSKMESPETVRLFLVIFNLENSAVYIGPATLDVLDGDEIVYSERQESAELENLYSIHQDLPEDGDFSLRVTLHGRGDLKCEIPFTLSSQKVHWGPWVAGSLFGLIAIAAVGARRARVAQDRRETKRLDRLRAKDGVAGR
jgi:hypothetical protein